MTRIDGERRRPSGGKKEEKMYQCEAGLHKNLPADWPDDFHSLAAAPICCCYYCTGVCAFCVCVSKRLRETVRGSIR